MSGFGVPVTVNSLMKAFPKLDKKVAKALVKAKIDDPEEYLELVNALVGGFGVESTHVGDRGMLYVNMGDAYEDTLIYDEDDWSYKIGAWGDWVEMVESEKDMDE